MNEHRALTNRMLWMQRSFDLGPAEVLLQKTPITFDISAWEIFCPLLSGAKLVLALPDGHRDPRYLCQVIREAQITLVHFVPSMLEAFLADDVGESCASLRRVVCSGEALSGALARRPATPTAAARMPRCAP